MVELCISNSYFVSMSGHGCTHLWRGLLGLHPLRRGLNTQCSEAAHGGLHLFSPLVLDSMNQL